MLDLMLLVVQDAVRPSSTAGGTPRTRQHSGMGASSTAGQVRLLGGLHRGGGAGGLCQVLGGLLGQHLGVADQLGARSELLGLLGHVGGGGGQGDGALHPLQLCVCVRGVSGRGG